MKLDDLFIIGFISVLLIIMIILNNSIRKLSPLRSFEFSKKKINFKRTIKYWAFAQAICIFCKAPNVFDDILMTILCPIIFISVIVVLSSSYSNDTGIKPPEYEKDEYESYKKSFNRDIKIRKILK